MTLSNESTSVLIDTLDRDGIAAPIRTYPHVSLRHEVNQDDIE
jgi:hypothetical protein